MINATTGHGAAIVEMSDAEIDIVEGGSFFGGAATAAIGAGGAVRGGMMIAGAIAGGGLLGGLLVVGGVAAIGYGCYQIYEAVEAN